MEKGLFQKEPFRVKTDVVWWKYPTSWFVCALFLAAILVSFLLPNPFPEPLTAYYLNDDVSIACAVLGPVYIIWGISFMYRCTDSQVGRILGSASFICTAWMLVTALKLIVTNKYVLHVIQYSQFVFLLVVLTLVFRAVSIDLGYHKTARWHRVSAAMWTVSTILSLLILTNDIHGLAFTLKGNAGSGLGTLFIGPLAWAIYAWFFILTVAFLIMLCFNHHQWNKRTVIVLFPCLLFWFAGCFLFAFSANSIIFVLMPIVTPFGCLLLTEICLQAGLVSGFWMFANFFKKLPFNTILLGHDKRVEYIAEDFVPLDEGLMQMFQEISLEPGESTVITLSEQSAYRIEGIHGGNLIVVEDRSSLAERARQLRSKQERLKTANRVLKGEHELRLALARRTKEDELFIDVKSTLDKVAEGIRVLLNEMPTGDSPEDIEERRRTLSVLKIFVAYCKRKGALVIAGKEDDEFTQARLQLVINETASDMRSIGIDCGALVDLHESLPVASVAVLYDCFYCFALIGLNVENPVLMAYVKDQDEQYVQMKCILEFDEYRMDSSISSVFENVLFPKDVDFNIEEDDGEFTLSVLVSRNLKEDR